MLGPFLCNPITARFNSGFAHFIRTTPANFLAHFIPATEFVILVHDARGAACRFIKFQLRQIHVDDLAPDGPFSRSRHIR